MPDELPPQKSRSGSIASWLPILVAWLVLLVGGSVLVNYIFYYVGPFAATVVSFGLVLVAVHLIDWRVGVATVALAAIFWPYTLYILAGISSSKSPSFHQSRAERAQALASATVEKPQSTHHAVELIGRGFARELVEALVIDAGVTVVDTEQADSKHPSKVYRGQSGETCRTDDNVAGMLKNLKRSGIADRCMTETREWPPKTAIVLRMYSRGELPLGFEYSGHVTDVWERIDGRDALLTRRIERGAGEQAKRSTSPELPCDFSGPTACLLFTVLGKPVPEVGIKQLATIMDVSKGYFDHKKKDVREAAFDAYRSAISDGYRGNQSSLTKILVQQHGADSPEVAAHHAKILKQADVLLNGSLGDQRSFGATIAFTVPAANRQQFLKDAAARALSANDPMEKLPAIGWEHFFQGLEGSFPPETRQLARNRLAHPEARRNKTVRVAYFALQHGGDAARSEALEFLLSMPQREHVDIVAKLRFYHPADVQRLLAWAENIPIPDLPRFMKALLFQHNTEQHRVVAIEMLGRRALTATPVEAELLKKLAADVKDNKHDK